MPNWQIISELVERSKGRLMVMNTEGIFRKNNRQETLCRKVEEGKKRMSAKELKEFNNSVEEETGAGGKSKWIEYRVKG